MSNSDTVQAIEKQIQQHRETVELGKSLERLRSNRDFKKIVVEGYLQQECVRLVLLKADINMQTVEKQASILKEIDSIGVLHQYFQTVYALAGVAEKLLGDNELEREFLIAEGI